MNWTFAPGVHCAAVGNDLVFLDLMSDAYFCLPDAGAATQPCPTDPNSMPAVVLDALSSADLITSVRTAAALPAALPDPAAHDLRHASRVRIGFGDLAAILGALLDLRRAGRDPSVLKFLELVDTAPPAPSDPWLLTEAAMAFSALLPWLPVRNQCLQRSALLMAFLRRKGLSADWIFAVRTWPFRAHCWVQSADLCLNDDFERLRAYTPILRR